MREISIQKNEAGQRMDKFLAKYLNKAPKSFFYKMMKKEYYPEWKKSSWK